jgi:PilZ domain-containing protein
MSDNKENLLNRRQEERMPLQGLVLKIRKAGIGNSLQQYETCRSIDLSLNGLAFATETLILQIPEKIDFILSIGDHEIKGNGVICNKRITHFETQYGLMFLSVSPEINTVLNHADWPTQELKNLAENMAEQFVHSLWEQTNSNNKWVNLKQQQLFDACRSYLLRLGEMGVKMTGYQANDPWVMPVQAVKIYRDNQHTLILKWPTPNSNPNQQMSVKLQINDASVTFVVNDEKHYETVLQVLEFLGEAIKNEVQLI